MGKSKIKKHKKRSTPNPYGLTTSENDIENSKLPSSTESAITTLLDQLQVPDAEENLCGLRRLSELFFNDDKSILNDPSLSINRELQQRFIKSVAPFLVDSRPDIRNAAAGALRNVSVAGGPNICEIMVTDDIMTPLTALIQKYATDDLLSGQKNMSAEQEAFEKEKIDTLVQAIHLLLNLCETSETAVKYFNCNNLLTVLLKFMNVSVGGVDLAVSVAQCLHTVSDENPIVLAALEKSEEDIAKIISVPNDEPSYLNLRTLTAGLLVNVHGGVAIKYSNYIFNVLGKVIEIDSRNELCRFSSEVPLDKEGMLSSDSVTKLEKLVSVIDTQITAFEILTNICSGEEDESSMDVESVNDSDFEDENEETDCAIEANDVSVSYPLSVNTHIHEALIKLNFLKNSFSKTNLPINVNDILCNHTDTKTLVKKYQKLRCRAFHFLNNLVSVLDAEDLGSPDDLFQMWAEISRMIISEKDDVEIVESSTAALRAVLKKLVVIQHPGLSQMSPSDLEIIFKIVLHCKDNDVCLNVTQIVAALGVFCANKHLDLPLKSIGEFLIEIAGRQGPLWLVAEALDALMDVFAEDDTDVVAKEISLVPHLSSILPVFKKKVRSERKNLGDHYALVTTANSNLARFITYKNNHFRSTKNGSC